MIKICIASIWVFMLLGVIYELRSPRLFPVPLWERIANGLAHGFVVACGVLAFGFFVWWSLAVLAA